ncbi:MAG: glycosyltransferase [bacterium]|nr:glycosyltransferase [bacterium]
MDKAPRVSVVLPCYNAARTIGRALDSLLAQTYAAFEVVVIDDGSRDGSSRLVARCAQRDERVRLIRQKHAGIVAALNQGLAVARGSLIARMDADDVALPERLARQVGFLEDHPEIGVVSCEVRLVGRNPAEGYASYVRWVNGLHAPEEIALQRFRESPLVHPAVMYRRELVERYGGYCAGDFPEDYELWLRWLEAGVRMMTLPEVLMEWHDHEGRLSRTHTRYRREAFYCVKADYLARWLARHNPHHPAVVIGGAGRLTRRRAELLQARGVVIVAYADVDRRKVGRIYHGAPVIHIDEIPGPESCFLLPYVGARGAAEAWQAFLERRGFIAGKSYLLAA